MLLEEILLFLSALLSLAVASYSDLKYREVPDWLSYYLIFSGLGLRFLLSWEKGWFFFLDGLLGFLFCLFLGYLFYQLNYWGGGDSKILMGMGGIIGLGFKEGFNLYNFKFTLLLFFMGIFFFGALLALVWNLFLAFKNKKKFLSHFQTKISARKKLHFFAAFLSLIFLVLSLFYPFFWILTIFPLGFFYLFYFIKVSEELFFLKKIKIKKLTEGDWLAESVFGEKGIIIPEGKSLEKKDLWRLHQIYQTGKIKKVLIKEGIPFVPSFFLSYLGVFLLSLF